MYGRTAAFPHQESRRKNGAAAIILPSAFGRGKRYIQPPSLVLRPAVAVSMWELAPQLIQRGPFRFLCPLHRQPEVRSCFWNGMLVPISETVAVEQIGPLPGGNLPQALMQFGVGFRLQNNLLRGFSVSLWKRKILQLIQADLIRCSDDADLLLHEFPDPPDGVGQKFRTALRDKATDRLHQTEAALLNEVVHVKTVISIPPNKLICLLLDKGQIIFQQLVPGIYISDFRKCAEFFIAHALPWEDFQIEKQRQTGSPPACPGQKQKCPPYVKWHPSFALA